MPRVVAIDDDRDFLGYIEDALADDGWEVITGTDSLSAAALVAREQPDVVLLDMRMQSKDSGWEVCAQLRENPTTQHVPIILCSADAVTMRGRDTWMRDNGIIALEKPFDLDDLYLALGAALARRDAARRHPSAASSA